MNPPCLVTWLPLDLHGLLQRSTQQKGTDAMKITGKLLQFAAWEMAMPTKFVDLAIQHDDFP